MTFRFLTSGESHGQCLNAIIEGIPAGFTLLEEDINDALARRQKGYGRGGRMAIETDKVKILSGVRFGKTTGAPIALEIMNKDWDNWQTPMSVAPIDIDNNEEVAAKKITAVRPGHADYAGAIKYNADDIRIILERSSARETATRVAVGAVALSILKNFGVQVFSFVTQIGKIKADKDITRLSTAEILANVETSEVRCFDKSTEKAIKETIDDAKANGDTLGGCFKIMSRGLPIGLGSHVHWDRRLDGKIAQAIISIPAIKAVSIGEGDRASDLAGSEFHDELSIVFDEVVRKSNNAGGLEGGMTNGEQLVVNATMKAIPTMKKPLNSIDLFSKEECTAHFERSDVCAVPAAAVVGEAMLAIVLLEAFLEKFGGDSKNEIENNFINYKKSTPFYNGDD